MTVSIDASLVHEHARDFFGLSLAKVKSLGSCQDVNFKIDTTDGRSFVAKYANPETKLEELVFQVRVLTFLQENAEGRLDLHFPRPVPLTHTANTANNNANGTGSPFITRVTFADGTALFFYLLTFVEGALLAEFTAYLSHETLFHFGREIARFNAILKDFPREEVSARECEWDPKLAYSVCSQRLSAVADERLRAQLSTYLEEMHSYVQQQSANLREQLVHCDLAHYNVVAKRAENGRPFVSGIIDFGDVSTTWLVGDLAVAIAPLLTHEDRPVLQYVASIVQGFHAITPLSEQEVKALWPLIVLRAMTLFISVTFLLRENPANAYLQEEIEENEAVLRRLMRVNPNVAEAAIRRATGCVRTAEREISERERVSLFAAPSAVVDVSVTSPVFVSGNWQCEHAAQTLLREAVAREKLQQEQLAGKDAQRVFAVPPGVAWLSRSAERSLAPPKTVPTFSLAYCPAKTPLIAPFACTVTELAKAEFVQNWKKMDLPQEVFENERCRLFELRGEIALVVIAGDVEITQKTVERGQTFGAVTTSSEPELHCIFSQGYLCELNRMYHTQPVVPPLFVTGRDFSSNWTAFIFDATRTAVSAEEKGEDAVSTALRQRYEHVAACQEHYFRDPPQIERGHAQYLYDLHGRAYLDTVNNVAVLGHSNAEVAQAALQQGLLLNTNSRFIYQALGRYAEQILSHIPKEIRDQGKLNRVLFVNSGSEATDLALRLARTVVSERRSKEAKEGASNPGVFRDVICVQGGYHGITTASDEVSTTLNDNPKSLETRASWIHLVPMPNPVRGLHLKEEWSRNGQCSDDQISTFYADFVKRKVEELTAEGRPPSAFIAEPLEGNAGGVILPRGYLRKVYEHVRAAGGLCICDEVQIGYGRLGNVFWGFEEHDIVPDLLTMAKAAGNGHPLGFVIANAEMVEEFQRAQGSFFSSAGGGPIGCVIGAKILEILEREKLQENALEVGDYMHQKLLEVQAKHPKLIAHIHGHGLYQGIELVRNYRKDKNTDSESESEIPEPATAEAYAICERMLELGAICHNTGDYSNVLKMKPPLCITKEDADFFATALDIACSGW